MDERRFKRGSAGRSGADGHADGPADGHEAARGAGAESSGSGVREAGEAAASGAETQTRGARLGRTADRTGELRRTAAGKTGELGRAAAGKTGELGRSAAGTTGEFGRIAASKSAEIGRTVARLDVPWARGRYAGLVREGIHEFAIRPLIDFYTRCRKHGVERLSGLEAPVIFTANHSSHLDAPTILGSLPRRWRRRTAVAAAADYFYKKRAVANAFALVFNTVPLARRGGGIGKGSTDHVDQLIEQRWNLLMVPEGTRSRDGRIGRLRTGAAVIAARHDVPIVPIYVKGTYQAMPPGRNWPRRMPGRFFSRRHTVEISFGEPIWPSEAGGREQIMERVRAFFMEHEDPPPKSARSRVGSMRFRRRFRVG